MTTNIDAEVLRLAKMNFYKLDRITVIKKPNPSWKDPKLSLTFIFSQKGWPLRTFFALFFIQ